MRWLMDDEGIDACQKNCKPSNLQNGSLPSSFRKHLEKYLAWVRNDTCKRSGNVIIVVEIENNKGEHKHFRIAGYDEIFDTKNYISIDSRMANALMKKEVGDEAVVKTGAGEFTWRISKIEYQKWRLFLLSIRN